MGMPPEDQPRQSDAALGKNKKPKRAMRLGIRYLEPSFHVFSISRKKEPSKILGTTNKISLCPICFAIISES